MRILWVSNSPIGPAANILNETYGGTSGGWIQTEYESLSKNEYEMFFLSMISDLNKGEVLKKSNDIGTLYCCKLPKPCYGIKNPEYLVKNIEEIISEIKPDIIHVWGTETCVSNIVSKCAPEIPKVIFVQGLIGIHQKYLGGFFERKNNKEYYKGSSLLSLVKDAMRIKLFKNQVDIEKETVLNCKNVIIDNDFGKAFFNSISEEIKCFPHPLLPNKIFSEYSWNYENVNPHTIFTIYSGNAEKGLQELLKAVAIVKRKYPDVKVKVPGIYPLDENKKLVAQKNDSYSCVLKNMIDSLDLGDNIEFLGKLDVHGMGENMSKAHIFVNPSCQEVHASTLREAMSVGTPCISTLCGCVSEFLKHNENGLIYRYQEYEVLAYYIEKLFGDKEFAESISANAGKGVEALNCEDSKTMSEIYGLIING